MRLCPGRIFMFAGRENAHRPDVKKQKKTAGKILPAANANYKL